MVVVAILVQHTLQLLTARGAQEEDEDRPASEHVGFSEIEPDGLVFLISSNASTIGFKVSFNFLTVSTVSFDSLMTSSVNMLIVSNNAVKKRESRLNKPPKRLRSFSVGIIT
jgi:hypothetical protein